MSWRPEGWDKIIEDKATLALTSPTGNAAQSMLNAFEAGADAMLEAICEEIGKEWNPYEEAAKHILYSGYHKEGFEYFRQKILSLLRPIKNPVGSADLGWK